MKLLKRWRQWRTARSEEGVTATTRFSRSRWHRLRSSALAVAAIVLVAVLLVRVQTARQLAGPVTIASRGAAASARTAPAFTLHTWNWWDEAGTTPGADDAPGQTVSLAALKGKPVVLNFWASWCEACRAEALTLQAAWQRYQGRGVVFIGVDFDDTEQDSAAFLREYGVTYFNGPDATDTISIKYGVAGLPTTVFINQQGAIISEHSGEIDATTLDQHIGRLLASGS